MWMESQDERGTPVSFVTGFICCLCAQWGVHKVALAGHNAQVMIQLRLGWHS